MSEHSTRKTMRIEELDAQILALETELASLKEQRNLMTSAIYRMPDELIARILRFVPGAGFPRDQHKHWLQSIPISRHFWDIALQTAELWSTIEFRRSLAAEVDKLGASKQIDVYQQRGFNRPLHLLVDISVEAGALTEPDPEVLRTIVLNAQRLHVHFRADSTRGPATRNNGESLCQSLLTMEWPALKILHLDAKQLYPMEDEISTRLLKGSSDTLTSLSLSGLWFIIDFPRLPRLSHVMIDKLCVNDHQDYTKIQEWLSDMPYLVSLDISCHSLERNAVEWKADDPLPLMNLLTVKLAGNLKHISRMLSILPDPSYCLSVNVDRGAGQSMSSPSPESITAIHHRILKYIRTSLADTTQNVEYKLVFLQRTGIALESVDELPRIMLAPVAPPSSILPQRSVQYRNECKSTDFPDFISLTRVLHFEKNIPYFEEILNSMQKNSSSITQLHFPEWTSYWRQSQHHLRIMALDRFLKARVESGEILITLSVDENCGANQPKSIESKWLREGLVRGIIETGRA